MQLTIQSNIKNELINIIREAIAAGKIDTESVRMVVLCPDESFQKLDVYISNEWDTYFDKEYVPVIGEINIAQWLDIADEALENQQHIDVSYIEHAKELEKKYSLTAPAISFKHLTAFDPSYVAFLVCLREELLKQIEAGLAEAATSFSQTDFKEIVGFFTYKLTYNLDNYIQLHAFNHPEGAGTFYKVELTQPDYITSRHYLRFYDNGFHLFRVKKSYDDDDDETKNESECTSYDISGIEFMFLREKEVFFRPNNEFKDWYIESDGPDVEKGEHSEDDFLKAFEQFFNQFPDKIFDPQTIPNPTTQKEAFDDWFHIILTYNIPLRYADLNTIFNFGEDAFRYYLQSIPKADIKTEPALCFLATRLFYLNRFEEALNTFDNIRELSESNRIEYLCALYLLNQKERYETYRSTSNIDKRTLDLFDNLWLLRESQNIEEITSIEKNVLALAVANKNNRSIRLIALVLVKVYTLTNNKEQALLYLQSVPTDETIEQLLLQNEFKSVPYILEAYNAQVQKRKSALAFDKEAASNALDTSEKKKGDFTKTNYEHCYYKKHAITISDYQWACPINAETFIAISKDNDNEYHLILAKIISGKSVETIQQQSIPGSRKIDSPVYLNGILYIADTDQGIVTYNVTKHSIEETVVVYKNKRKKAKYTNITIADGYLFASNNSYLEIYDLHTPEAVVLSDSLYIDSGYYLFVHKNLLVVGAGGGLLILADISDKKNPVYVSTIKEDSTPGKMHVEFIDNYMVCRSVYDISNPGKPQWIQYVGEELAPIYYFSPKPEIPIISTGEDFLFTTLTQQNTKPVYTNWLKSLNKNNACYERAISNLATAYIEDIVITYTKYDITIWEKGVSPVVEQIDIHNEVETMVNKCFDFIADTHPTFRFSKAVLEYNPLFRYIIISFHQSSSPGVLANSVYEHSLPIISSLLMLHDYYREVLQKEYNPEKTQLVFDADAIMNKLMQDSRFKNLAAAHVLVIADKKSYYVHYPENSWHPFYIAAAVEAKEETITDILLSRNDASITQLSIKVAEDTVLLNELLDILNMKVFIQRSDSPLTNKISNTDESAEMHELIDSEEEVDNEEEIYCHPEYITGPYYAPAKEIQTDIVPAGYLPNTMETYDLKSRAYEIVCKLPDRKLVRNILFNGMKFGYMHYNLKDMPADYGTDEMHIREFVRNNHGTWNEFGNDTDIRFFLMENIHSFQDDELKIRIVYKCGHLSHPLIGEYIRGIIESGMMYEDFRGDRMDIDLSTLPMEVIKPLETLLLEKSAALEHTTDSTLLYFAEQQLPYIYALLQKIGHEHISEIVQKRIQKAVKYCEEYNHLALFDEDEYESEDVFLARLNRETKIKRLLQAYKNSTGSLWPEEEPLELYTESWNKTIEALLQQGTVSFGNAFKTDYVARLVKNIPLNETYANDRTFAYEFIQYTYRNIEKKPQMASLAEPLILAADKNRDVFPTDFNIAALKDKTKYTLLQAAWNDLKDKQFDLAEQKADAILILDPNMGQVYFLKARLLWLREGIPAYLSQQEFFIEKATGDTAALARLYNLTGCALDIEKRYEEALPYFKKAAVTAPNDAMYIANVAEIYYKLGKPKEALQHAKSARSNGNEAVILKEIIDNKGVLTDV
jgi:hypothetical protein